MLKKRLIGVITVKNNWAVQSFGYRRYLPLGNPVILAENLDRWGVDEILIHSIDRSVLGSGPDLEMLDRIAQLGLGTPLIYGGGIRNVEDGVQVVQRGADRITVDALISEQISTVKHLSDRLGAQAVIASFPVSIKENALLLYDYKKRIEKPWPNLLTETINSGIVSEVLLNDWLNDGHQEAFNSAIVDKFPSKNVSLIPFGGISNKNQILELLANPIVSAIAIGNFLNYRELAVQHYKNELMSPILRKSSYAAKHSLLKNV
jgi:cyclase